MASADRRAKLLSGILGAKGASTANELETPPAQPVEPSAEVDRSSVLKIASRRPESAYTESPSPSPPPVPPAPAEGVLYSKGAATASTFKPSYWSFDHKDDGAPTPPETVVTRIPAAAAPPPPPAPLPSSEPAVAETPKPLSRAMLKMLPEEDEDETERGGLSRVYILLAAACAVLLLAGGGFVYWQSLGGESTAPQTALLTDRPATALPVPAQEITPPAGAPAPTALKPAPVPPVVAPVPAPTPVPAPPVVAKAPAAVPSVPPASDTRPKTPDIASVTPAIPPPPALDSKPAAAPPPPVASAPAAAPPASTVSSQELAQLVARGDELLATGDIAAARLFYQRAAEQGSALAATAVGQTYDPIYLEQARVRGVRGDAKLAAEWYRKATAAGDPQADLRLKRLLARTGG